MEKRRRHGELKEKKRKGGREKVVGMRHDEERNGAHILVYNVTSLNVFINLIYFT